MRTFPVRNQHCHNSNAPRLDPAVADRLYARAEDLRKWRVIMFERRDVEFAADDGLVLRGWLFVPDGGDRPRAAITMAHGYAGVKGQGIEPFAKAFADTGFSVFSMIIATMAPATAPFEAMMIPLARGLERQELPARYNRALLARAASVLELRQPRCRRVPAELSGGHNSQNSESEQVTMATRFPNSETTP